MPTSLPTLLDNLYTKSQLSDLSWNRQRALWELSTAVQSVCTPPPPFPGVSHHHEPWDAGVFASVGIDPAEKTYLLLKSRIHYRAGFADMAQATFICDGRGVTTSDNSVLRYENVRRPIYPLDPVDD